MEERVEGRFKVLSAEQFRNASSGIDVSPAGNTTETRDGQSSKQDDGSDAKDEGKTTVSSAEQFWNVPNIVILSGIVMCVNLVQPANTSSVDVTEVKKRISSKLVTVFQSVNKPLRDVTDAASE